MGSETKTSPSRRVPPPTVQKLLWCPPGVDGEMPVGGHRLPYTGPRPVRLWTLYEFTDESSPPTLPIVPVHHRGAFLGDHVHDWVTQGGCLRYYTRAVSGGVWLLLEVPTDSGSSAGPELR